MITLTVDVTEDDIAKGVRCDGSRCPLQRAISRAYELPPGHSLYVRDESVLINGDNLGFITLPLPEKAIGFAKGFDSGLCMSALQFKMEYRLPSEGDTGFAVQGPVYQYIEKADFTPDYP